MIVYLNGKAYDTVTKKYVDNVPTTTAAPGSDNPY